VAAIFDLQETGILDDLDGTGKTIASGGDGLDGSGTLVGDSAEAGGFSVGSVFAGRYRILSEGKAGGMGVVYKCLDQTLEQETALKMIHPRLLRSGDALKRFRQEVSISRKLTHEGIVRVHDIGSHGGTEYFTMEWVKGVSLRDVINERKKKGQPFSLEEASGIIYSLSEALQHAHRYTIHRDIKPENIMIGEDGKSNLKLMDFGIAKMLTVSQFTTTSIQMGTPYYMAPEQKLDTGHVDRRADIYSVGVILFELLTLENTVGPELPSDLNLNLPKEVDDVFRRAVALKPERRYQEIGALAAALVDVVRTQKRITNSLGMDFALIPAGTFMMGSPLHEEERSGSETQHQVTISKAFYMQTTQVTQGQWKRVMGSNQSYFKENVSWWKKLMGNNPSSFQDGDDHPVEQVSWNNVQEFILKLNNLENTDKYRLPTEAEWEYAARAGTQTRFHSGDSEADLSGVGWHTGNSGKSTHPVGEKEPNTWGLYDMHGNVWEWCQDWYGAYPSGRVTDPYGPSSGSHRVFRGGSWDALARYCRSAHRNYDDPGSRVNLGFRLLRTY
jgi:formylglycine-generating enzyme required for sulfatase activity